MAIKKILIDLSALRHGYCGLWEYAYRFGTTLLSLNDPTEFDLTFLVPSDHPFPKDAPIKIISISFFKRHIKFFVPRHDLYHAISYPSPFMPTKRYKGKCVATIHDLNFLYEKSDSKVQKYLNFFQKGLSRVDHLVFISRYTQSDAEKYLKYEIQNTLIYNGVAFAQNVKTQKPLRLDCVNSPYLFTVSTFMRKKNLHTIVQMMFHLPEYKLVIAGKVIHASYFKEVKHLVRKLNLEHRVFFAGEITEAERAWLYAHCDAFLFPSIVEGFGIPPIESMNFGKPVFVSDKTSLPEICGEYAFYWKDFEPEYMADTFKTAMICFRNNPAYPQRLKEYASRYSWSDNVSQHLELYRKLLLNSPCEQAPIAPVFSILIPTWNNLSLLQLCVESIRKNSKYEHQLIIHVNEGVDGTLQWVEEQGIDFTYSKQNTGVCHALNDASKLAKSDYIMYINDDMYVCPGWDEALWNEIAAQPDEKFYLSSTAIEPFDVHKNAAIVPYFYGLNPEEFEEERLLSDYQSLPFHDWCGSSWPPAVVHRKMWDVVGGYSVEFSPGFYSDPDFSMKLWQAGVRRFKGVSASRVYHFLESSTKRLKGKTRTTAKGSHLFLKKWGITARTFYRFYLRMGDPYHELTKPTVEPKFLWKKFLCKIKLIFIKI